MSNEFDFLMNKKQAADNEAETKAKRINDFKTGTEELYQKIEKWLEAPIKAKAVSLNGTSIDIKPEQGNFRIRRLEVHTPDKIIFFESSLISSTGDTIFLSLHKRDTCFRIHVLPLPSPPSV